MRDEDRAANARIALASGIATARFEREVRDAMDARSRESVAKSRSVEEVEGGAIAAEASLPIHRRMFRHLLKGAKPLALPFLHRFQVRVAHAVDTSSAIRNQGTLISELRSELREMRSEIAFALDLHPGADSIASRMMILEDRLVGLHSLAVANLDALASQPEAEPERQDDKGLADEIRSVRQRLETQTELIERLLRLRVVPLGNEVLVRTSFGWLIIPKEDRPYIAAMAEHGDALEPGTVQVIRAILSPGDVAVDVGANVGAILLAMASMVGPSGSIVGIEPTPRCIEALHKTVVINGLATRCGILPFAAGARPGKATLHLGSTLSHNSLHPLPFETGTTKVDVETLDNLVSEDLIPALVKIDVEGAELEVLAGMSKLLKRSPNVALVVELGASHLERTHVSIEQWVGAFADVGFRPWAIDEASGQLSAFRSTLPEAIPSINLLMLRDDPSRWPDLRISR